MDAQHTVIRVSQARAFASQLMDRARERPPTIRCGLSVVRIARMNVVGGDRHSLTRALPAKRTPSANEIVDATRARRRRRRRRKSEKPAVAQILGRVSA